MLTENIWFCPLLAAQEPNYKSSKLAKIPGLIFDYVRAPPTSKPYLCKHKSGEKK